MEGERTFVGIEKEDGERESDASSSRKVVKLREGTERNLQTKGIGRERNSQERSHVSVDYVIRRERERVKKKKLSKVSVNKSYFSYERKGETSTSERGKTSRKTFRSP